MAAKKAKTYEKPATKKQDKMRFPLRGVENVNKELACRQCSSCHGCR
jgi:hypothetical protein